MKIPVLIETTPDHRYRAAGAEPFAGVVEADTPDAALAQMRRLIDDRVAGGALVAELELPEGANPWLDGAGMFRDDPLFDDWQAAIADRRRQVNDSADTP